MSPAEIRTNDLAQLKGASSWLNDLLLKSENYVLNKREFYDAICLRYRWQIKYLPTTLLALITPALSQRQPLLRRPLFRQEQISTYRHLGPLLTPR